MQNNLKKTTNWILVHEGGYVNHPEDPGGATNMGVTQRTYDAWRRRAGKATQTVRNITFEEVVMIYKDQYWDKVWGDLLPDGLDYTLYDFAINSGPSRAIEFVQRILGNVAVDGVMGNETYDAIRSKNDIEQLIIDINFERWKWLKRLRHWKTFGKGWTRRVMGEEVGVQERDKGVIDRSILLLEQVEQIDPPKERNDGANQGTKDEPLSRTQTVKEGLNLDTAGKIGAGSIPPMLTAMTNMPEGPIQWAFAGAIIIMSALAGYWAFKKLL